MGVLKNRRNRTILIVIVIIAAVVVVIALASMGFNRRRNSMLEEFTSKVGTAEATVGSVSTTVTGSGTLQTGEGHDVVAPAGVKISKVLVEEGDKVKKGQELATVDEVSIAAVLLDVEGDLSDINEQISDLGSNADVEGTTEYYENIVLQSQKEDLDEIKSSLDELMETKTIYADKKGVIGTVYAVEDEELTTYASTSDTSSSVTTSSLTSILSSLFSTSSTTGDISTESGVSDEDITVQAQVEEKTDPSGAGALQVSAAEVPLRAEVTEITDCSISVTTPATGNTPQSSIASADGYTGTITWSPSDSTFKSGTTYTAKIVLTANENYAFSDSLSLSVSGASAVSGVVSGDGSTVTISAVFAQTSSASSSSSSSSSESTTATAPSTGIDTDAIRDSIADAASSLLPDSSTDAESIIDNLLPDSESLIDALIPDTSSLIDSMIGDASLDSLLSGSSLDSLFDTSSLLDSDLLTSGSSSSSVYEAVAFSIVDEKEAVIALNVDELDINSLERGQAATITLDALGDEEFAGTITSVSTAASSDSSSARYPVEITLDKTDDMLFGMSASVTINVAQADNALLIPVAALQEEGNKTFVYTKADRDGNLSGEVEVTTGLSDSNQVAILSGLEEGDTVYYQRSQGDVLWDTLGIDLSSLYPPDDADNDEN